MRPFASFSLAFLILVASAGCGARGGRPVAVTPAVAPKASIAASTPSAAEKSNARGYENSLNRLIEHEIAVKDDLGKPAVRDIDGRAIPDVELKIVWTHASQYGWNYCVPELHGGKNLFETEYPSEPFFLEKKLGAKQYLSVSIPDTPYAFYILNGRATPFFYDEEKAVIWELRCAELESAFHDMRTLSAHSKKIIFSAPGGDMAEFLVVDFSDRDQSPAVSYYVRYDGP